MTYVLNEQLDACELYQYTKNVKGLKSDSASPSDTWIVELKDDTEYEGKELKSVFLKYFIDPALYPSSNPNGKIATEGLLYEQQVYLKIRDLIKNGVCDNFVKIYGIGNNCSLKSLEKMLDATGVDMRLNLYRNIDYMYNLMYDRPSINDNYLNHKRVIHPSFNFHFILNEVMEKSKSTSFYNFCKHKNYNLDSIMPILFEQTFACYSMYMNGVMHNDLHMGNSYIYGEGQYVDKTYVYNFDGDTFSYNSYRSKYTVKVFDFDRAYDIRIGKNENQSGQTYNNYLIPLKDIMKTFCLLYKEYNERGDYASAQKLVEIITYDKSGTLTPQEKSKREQFATNFLSDFASCFWGYVSVINYDKINDKYTNLLDAMTNYMEKNLKKISQGPDPHDRLNICVKQAFRGPSLNVDRLEEVKQKWREITFYEKHELSFWDKLKGYFV